MKSKFCIYLRVSTKRQGDSGLGLEAQRKMCLDLIEREGGECIKEFQDVESGKSRTRPGLWGAIDFCKAQSCTLVIAKLDRLARDVEFTFKVIGTGIQIRFVDMPIINTMILGVFASVAQYERELISSRTKSALDSIKDNIKKNGGHVSKTGRYVKKLGREKGADLTLARASSGRTKARMADEWRQGSALYLWVTNQILKGRRRRDILAEAVDMYNKGTLSRWAKEIETE